MHLRLIYAPHHQLEKNFMAQSVKYPLTCTLCFPGVIDIGKLGRNVWLAKWDRRYVLFFGQGHKGDDIHTFKIRPFSDPTKGLSENKLTEKVMNKFKKADNYTSKILKMDPWTGYSLVKSCMAMGYRPNTHGFNFKLWLFFKCGDLIEKMEKMNTIKFAEDFLKIKFLPCQKIMLKQLEKRPNNRFVVMKRLYHGKNVIRMLKRKINEIRFSNA